MPRYRIRHQGHDLEIPPGEFLVGRSRECQLALEDPLISRRHAAFVATNDKLFVEDLGSRNGIKVNGQKVNGRVQLAIGDVVNIGAAELSVNVMEAVDEAPRRKPAVTISSEVEDGAATVGLLSGLVDKALAMGRIDEAERIMGNLLADVLHRIQSGTAHPQAVADGTRYALRLAAETGKPVWVDWVFNAYHAANKVLPMPMVDELHALGRKIRYPVTPALRSYVDSLRAQSDKLSPTERFALQRIEGLVRVLLA